MNVTSVSLLERLKAKPGDADWLSLRDIYLPLIRGWLRRVPGLGDEADDLAQEVFLVIIREIRRFERRREGSFRAWLRQVTVNRARTYCKKRNRRPTVGLDPADGFLDQLTDPQSELAHEWDRNHDQHVFEKLLTSIRSDFQPTTWEAFQRFALDGQPAARVAEELGVSVNSVLQAKYRILKRLRDEAGDLFA